MNDRLLNNPVSPREIDPSIPRSYRRYRALERDPAKRYPNAHLMISDLQHLDQIGIAERTELRDWELRCSSWTRSILTYIMLARFLSSFFSCFWLPRGTIEPLWRLQPRITYKSADRRTSRPMNIAQ